MPLHSDFIIEFRKLLKTLIRKLSNKFLKFTQLHIVSKDSNINSFNYLKVKNISLELNYAWVFEKALIEKVENRDLYYIEILSSLLKLFKDNLNIQYGAPKFESLNAFINNSLQELSELQLRIDEALRTIFSD